MRYVSNTAPEWLTSSKRCYICIILSHWWRIFSAWSKTRVSSMAQYIQHFSFALLTIFFFPKQTWYLWFGSILPKSICLNGSFTWPRTLGNGKCWTQRWQTLQIGGTEMSCITHFFIDLFSGFIVFIYFVFWYASAGIHFVYGLSQWEATLHCNTVCWAHTQNDPYRESVMPENVTVRTW